MTASNSFTHGFHLPLKLAFAFILATLFSNGSGAKEFKNSYLAFDLPEQWACVSEGTEFVCKNEKQKAPNDAIIIFTAKETGPSDTLEAYEVYLKQPKNLTDPLTGKTVVSRVSKVARNRISGQDWVDGLHVSSEVPNYYTRYLATTKGRIAILITYSAHVSSYARYSADFIRSINSLRVVATPDLFKSQGGTGLDTGGEIIGGPGGAMGGDPMATLDPNQIGGEPSGASQKKQQMFMFAIILAAIGIYMIMKFK